VFRSAVVLVACEVIDLGIEVRPHDDIGRAV
jgi:hypothetical protein